MTPDEVGSLKFPAPPTSPVKPWRKEWKNGRNDYIGLTQGALDALRLEWKTYERAVIQFRAECEEVVARASRLLVGAGFPESGKLATPGKSKTTARPLSVILWLCCAPHHELQSLWVSDEEEWLRLSWARQRDKEAADAAVGLRDRAIAWLLTRGQVYGRDFSAETAAACALRIAGDEKIAETIKRAPFSFNGQNCEGSCDGWDGESRRCQCGNRRVSWTVEGTFEHPTVYGEAY